MLPHFRSREFLLQRFADALTYLYPRGVDEGGENGGTGPGRARLTGDFALAYQEFGDPAYLRVAQQGLAALAEHREHQGPLRASVLSAYARAAIAGVPGARPLAERAAASLARQEPPPCASTCMALVDAYDATAFLPHLHHAEALARAAVAAGFAAPAPGHALPWTRALMMLERRRRHLPQNGHWLLPAAAILFEQAPPAGVTATLDPDGDALAAAALLGACTGRMAYWASYDALWAAHCRRADRGAQARLIGACAQALEVIASAP